MRKYFIFIFIFLSNFIDLHAQNAIKGFVYEDGYRTPMPEVFVYTVSGYKTITDSLGFFSIPVITNDSIYFSYKSKTTKKFSVDTIADPNNFEIAIHLNVHSKKSRPPGYLPDVIVYSRDYRTDSIRNRQEYAKIFDFQKPGLSNMVGIPKIGNVPIPLGVYMDVNAIAQSFQFRKNRRRENYRDFAIWLEQEKYIDHRFSKKLVGSLTNFSGDKLDEFMKVYRPEFLTLITMNDVELSVYIKKSLENYNNQNTPPTFMQKLRNSGIVIDRN